MSLFLVEMEVDFLRMLQGARVQDGTDPGYHLHAWIAAVLGPDVLQPFLWVERRRRLLGYSTMDRATLLQRADQFAGPEARAALREIHTKEMPASWPVGMRAGFSLRAAPTVRLSKAIEGRAPKGGEVDVFNAARWRGDERERGEVYEAWVGEQLMRHGSVELSSFRIEGHHLARMLRREQRGERVARSIVLPDLRCSGVIMITDSDAFGRLLARGVGRHRAFGFGMLMLRPC